MDFPKNHLFFIDNHQILDDSWVPPILENPQFGTIHLTLDQNIL